MGDLKGGQTMELFMNANMEEISETFWCAVQKEHAKWTPLLYDEGFQVAKDADRKELDNASGPRESQSLQSNGRGARWRRPRSSCLRMSSLASELS